MRSYGAVVLVVIAALAGVIYIGGNLQVAGMPIFAHLDSALGTTFFMGCYYKFAAMLERKQGPKQDEWTKVHQDWKKVLKNTVE
jgi:hypothetical protein